MQLQEAQRRVEEAGKRAEEARKQTDEAHEALSKLSKMVKSAKVEHDTVQLLHTISNESQKEIKELLLRFMID